MTLTRLAALAAFTLIASPAFAHTGIHANGFWPGFAHPFNGLDHVLVMAGIGVWAAQLGGPKMWLVPAAFIAAMVLGAGLALTGFPLPAVELGIAGSVVAIGVLLGLGARMPAPAAAAMAGLMALFHGHAHGAELPAMASAWTYAAGFMLSTAALHGIGLGLAHLVLRRTRPWLLRVAGSLTALAGLAMVSAG